MQAEQAVLAHRSLSSPKIGSRCSISTGRALCRLVKITLGKRWIAIFTTFMTVQSSLHFAAAQQMLGAWSGHHPISGLVAACPRSISPVLTFMHPLMRVKRADCRRGPITSGPEHGVVQSVVATRMSLSSFSTLVRLTGPPGASRARPPGPSNLTPASILPRPPATGPPRSSPASSIQALPVGPRSREHPGSRPRRGGPQAGPGAILQSGSAAAWPARRRRPRPGQAAGEAPHGGRRALPSLCGRPAGRSFSLIYFFLVSFLCCCAARCQAPRPRHPPRTSPVLPPREARLVGRALAAGVLRVPRVLRVLRMGGTVG